jgi:NAD(P)H-dependent FMN reductase
MIYILGLSGSLRRASFNSMLLDAAAQLAPAGITVEIGSIRGIPLYDGDVEATPHGVHGRLLGVYFRAPQVKPRLPQWW